LKRTKTIRGDAFFYNLESCFKAYFVSLKLRYQIYRVSHIEKNKNNFGTMHFSTNFKAVLPKKLIFEIIDTMYIPVKCTMVHP
jgi:hypothetical protein